MQMSVDTHIQRGRLVINIGGAKMLVSNIGGGKLFGKCIFRQHSKKIEKILQLYKISDDLFLVIENFFQKFTPFIQNLLPFLCIFLSLSLFLLSFMFFKYKKIKNSRLNYWGRAPGLPPESTPMLISRGKL